MVLSGENAIAIVSSQLKGHLGQSPLSLSGDNTPEAGMLTLCESLLRHGSKATSTSKQATWRQPGAWLIASRTGIERFPGTPSGGWEEGSLSWGTFYQDESQALSRLPISQRARDSREELFRLHR